MFILRVYTKAEKVESNTIMGDSYNLVHRTQNPIEFERTKKEIFANDLPPEVYAFIIFDGGATVRPLYSGQNSYVMTESGQTFSNVSDR